MGVGARIHARGRRCGMRKSPQAARRAAHTYPLPRPRSCAVGGSGGSVLQVWPRPRGLGMGAGGVPATYVTPRTPHRKGCAHLGGQTGRGEGRAIAFSNREGVACAGWGLSRGNRGGLEGVTLGSPKVKPHFATLANPRVDVFFPRVGRVFPRIRFLGSAPFSFFSSSYVEREKGKEGGKDRKNGIPGLAHVFPGSGMLVTGAIPGLHEASPGFPWIAGGDVSFQINGLGGFWGESPCPRVEMPLSPLAGLSGGVLHG